MKQECRQRTSEVTRACRAAALGSCGRVSSACSQGHRRCPCIACRYLMRLPSCCACAYAAHQEMKATARGFSGIAEREALSLAASQSHTASYQQAAQSYARTRTRRCCLHAPHPIGVRHPHIWPCKQRSPGKPWLDFAQPLCAWTLSAADSAAPAAIVHTFLLRQSKPYRTFVAMPSCS